MRERNQVAIGGLVADQFAEAALTAPDRAGDGVDLGQPLLGGARQRIEAFQRSGGSLQHVRHFDRPLGTDPIELGHERSVGTSGDQLHDLRPDEPFGDDPRHGVGADQWPQPLVDPQHQLDRPAGRVRRHHAFDNSRVNPLDSHAVTSFDTADRHELRPHVEGGLHSPVPPRHLVNPERGQRQHRQRKPDVGRRTPRTDVAPHGAYLLVVVSPISAWASSHP